MESVIFLICASKRRSSSALACISLTSYLPTLDDLPRICQLPIPNEIVVDTVGIFEMGYGDRRAFIGAEIVFGLKKCGAMSHLPGHVRGSMAQEMLVWLQNSCHGHLEAVVNVRRSDVSTCRVSLSCCRHKRRKPLTDGRLVLPKMRSILRIGCNLNERKVLCQVSSKLRNSERGRLIPLCQHQHRQSRRCHLSTQS